MEPKEDTVSFTDYPWQISYRTAYPGSDGKPINILSDFYLPALKRAVSYDRVAGYFNSTSLAGASQGFSVFPKQNSKARFIVGVNFSADYIQRILDAHAENREDTELLIRLLTAELESFNSWPMNVQNGVHLLAWMAAKGILEIRLAFRINLGTGRALPYNAREDGYVYRNWGLFKDAAENRMYISGILNESEASLNVNAESIEVHCEWKSEDNRKRVESAEYEFEMLWDDLNPYVRVLRLPQKVREYLITIAQSRNIAREIEGNYMVVLEAPSPSTLERLKFALIKDGPKLPGGRFVGMETLPITPWPHQRIAAQRLIESWPYSYLLCNEVGCGKIVEAGLAIRSLYLSGLLEKVLIIAPESHTSRWQREMVSKFFMPFAIGESETPPMHRYLMPLEENVHSESIYSPYLNILSTRLVTNPQLRSALFGENSFDLTLVDDVHRAAVDQSELLKLLSEDLSPKSKSLYLCTSVPMLLDDQQLHRLMKLTRRIGPFEQDAVLSQWYYDLLKIMLRGFPLTEIESNFLRRAVRDIENYDPFYFDFIHRTLMDGKNRAAIQSWLEYGVISEKIPYIEMDDKPNLLSRLLIAAAPLSRVMIRHTRSMLNLFRQEEKFRLKLAERIVLPIRTIRMTDHENAFYEQLHEYRAGLRTQIAQIFTCSEDFNTIDALADGYIGFLFLRFSSSLYALRETIRRRLEKISAKLKNPTDKTMKNIEADDGETEADTAAVNALLDWYPPELLEWEQNALTRMLFNMTDLSEPSSKIWELMKILDYSRRIHTTGRIQQTVVFTRFHDTLIDIFGRIRQADSQMRIGTYSVKGGQYVDPETFETVSIDREFVKRLFLREEIDVLICTDEAAEGLNLQTSDMLINYDQPWDPIKLEQRISRIDRIGQKYDHIEILSLCHEDSPEEIVYGRLAALLENPQITEEMNIIQPTINIPLPVYRNEFLEIAEGRLTEADLELRVRERIDTIQERASVREIPPTELVAAYLRMHLPESKNLRQTSNFRFPASNFKSPVSLNMLWETLYGSKYFQELGCSPQINEKTLELKNIQGIDDGTVITASREIYEHGLKGFKGKLHFATYGDPVFEILLNHIDAFGLPPCIRRIEIEKSDFTIPTVGYVVACLDKNGRSVQRLITSQSQIESVIPDEGGVLSQEDIADFQRELETIAKRESQSIYLANRTEKLSQTAGISHLAFNYLIMAAYIETIRKAENFPVKFKDLVRTIENACREDNESILISNIPREPLEKLYGLLFDPHILSSEHTAQFQAPVPLMRAALASVSQLAETLKKGESDIMTEEVLSALKKELSRLQRIVG